MPDDRFFRRAGPFSLGTIAALIGAEPLNSGDDAILIDDIAPLDAAQASDISVFSDPRYFDVLRPSRARAIIISPELARHAADHQARLILVGNPRLAYAQVGELFYPTAPLEPHIDANARVHPTAQIGVGSRIEAGAVIGSGVEIGERCHVGFNTVLADGVTLGSDSRIGANCSISHAMIGQRVTVETGVTIGSSGFGFVPGPNGLTRMLQLGRVLIEDGVQIGANCAIDRGATGDTVIGTGTVIDNLVQIAHNVRIGRHCVICAQVGIAGSTVIGDGVMLGGQVGVVDHLTVGSRSRIAAMAGVLRNVAPGSVLGGYPAMPVRSWHRQTISLARLFKSKSANNMDE
jgi:UDP-3-O-[3-hydroxymyristoyl] glucosamine N-acyltransferase